MKRNPSIVSSLISTALLSLAACLVVAVVAPSVSDAQNADKPKVKTFDFSGDDIDGELVKPDGEFIDPRQFASHTNLIRIRKDFIKEIIKSAEDL
ncbi:MAG: hypothetical protein GY811_13335 [Myxococcales bacterium]|nr:hypothetical protein [Myxococcales bacterium]